MATYSGMRTSYTNTEPQKRMVSDRILLTNPLKIKTLLRLGMDVGKFAMVNREGKIYEWLEDTYVPETAAVTSGLASAATTTSFTPDSLTLLQPGDVLLIDSEQMWVSSVSSGIPQVTRAWGSTSGVTHANSSTLTIVGRARIDGDTADDSPTTEVSTGYNYTQIMQRSVSMARTMQKIAKYGMTDPLGYMIDKRTDELLRSLNMLPFYGERYVGTATAARSSGGLATYITDNLTDAASASLTRKMIDDTLQDIWDDGHSPDLIICNGWARRKINDFYEGFVTTERSEEMGGVFIQKLVHPITGDVIDVMTDRALQTNKMWILSSEHISFYPFDPFFYEELAKVGDFDNGQIVGEYGFVVRNDKAHGLVYDFSTTA